MSSVRVVVLDCLLLLSSVVSVRAADPVARLNAALQVPALRGAQVAALVVKADDGKVLFDHGGDRALTPASNTKILTAVAALATFGPAHQFTTEVYGDAAPDAKGSVQTLIVRGGGDPALTSEEWWRLAADLRLRGLRRVRGDIVLDDSLFDRERWNPVWGPVSSRAYYAPIGALSANYGAFSVEVQPPDKLGGKAEVFVDPPVPYLALRSSVKVVGRGAPASLSIQRDEGADSVEHVVVSGAVRAGEAPEVFYRNVSDPALYAGAVLRMQLEANGIAVSGRVRTGGVPPGAHPLLHFEGKPLGEIVRLFLKYSNNDIAESLLKSMGASASGPPGTWENGLQALRGRLASLGIDTASTVLTDGSGLSYENRIAPRTLVDALRTALRSFGFGPDFVAALPIAARDGTLEKRAKEVEGMVRAKTGLLTKVTALSGYAHTRGGDDLVFSILVNGYGCDDAEAMAAVDRFVEELVRGD